MTRRSLYALALLALLCGSASATPVTPQDMGATCNGTADDTDALNKLVLLQTEITIASGTCHITASATWPAGKVYRFAPGARLAIDDNQTLTINGRVEAPDIQIFTGGGAVIGIRDVRAAWFGATGNGTSDDQPALLKASECVRQSYSSDGGGDGTLRLSGAQATYRLGRQWTVITMSGVNIRILGGGSGGPTKIAPLASFDTSGGSALLRITTDGGGVQNSGQFELSNLTIQKDNASTVQVGLSIGAPAGSPGMRGFRRSIVRDAYIFNFPVGTRIAQHSFLIFENVSWSAPNMSATNVLFTTDWDDGSAFTGDTDFRLCSFVGASDSDSYDVRIINQFPKTEINGIGFDRSAFGASGAHISVEVSNGGHAGDYFIAGTNQLDGFGRGSIRLKADGVGPDGVPSLIHHFQTGPGLYHKGLNKGGVGVEVRTTNGAAMDRLDFVGGRMSAVGNNTSPVIVVGNITGSFSGWTFDSVDVPNGSVMLINTPHFNVVDNKLTRSAGDTVSAVQYFITLGATWDYAAFMGNMSGGYTMSGNGPYLYLTQGSHFIPKPLNGMSLLPVLNN